MTTSLATLAARLETAVPALNDVPADYEQLVRDAVAQLSNDAPLVRTTTINVVAGTAAYDLPADFLFLIELSATNSINGVMISDAGLIPMATTADEYTDLTGDQIVFVPTPTYTASRTLRYAAGYALDNSDSYPRLSENAARVALLYAQHLALLAQANAVAPQGWRYSIGDEMIDKSNQGKGLATQAERLHSEYQTAVKRLQGYGSVGRVNAWD